MIFGQNSKVHFIAVMVNISIGVKMKKYISNNILIIVLTFVFVILGLVGSFAYELPTDLTEITGFIQSYNQRDGKWYDNIFGGSKGSYFNVRLEDDSFFEATGICYDNIDRNLFKKLKIGEEITITYNNESGRPDRIFAIKYQDIDYLMLDDSLNGYKQTAKIMHVVGPIMCGFSILSGVVLLMINYKKNRGK